MRIASIINLSIRSLLIGIFLFLSAQSAQSQNFLPLSVNEYSRYVYTIEHSGRFTQVLERVTRITSEYGADKNVRELKHAVERACLLTAHPLLRPTDFEIPDQLIEDYYPDNINTSAAEAQPILRLADYNREQEKKYLSHVLRHLNGHVGQAAAALGIGRKTLWEKTKKFEIKAIS